MSLRRERLAAALRVIAHALLELAALEREPEEATSGGSAQPSVAPSEQDVRARGVRTLDCPLPPGMTAWVSAGDVARAVGCSHSKAHDYLRAAAGRSVGTGHLLRVPVDVWEAWARDNLIDGLRHERRRTSRASRRTSPPADATEVGASKGATVPHQYRRPGLSLFPRAESKLPLIPTLVPAKR